MSGFAGLDGLPGTDDDVGNLIEVWFDKKDSAATITGKIFSTLLQHRDFNKRATFEYDRVGTSLFFTNIEGGTPAGAPTSAVINVHRIIACQ